MFAVVGCCWLLLASGSIEGSLFIFILFHPVYYNFDWILFGKSSKRESLTLNVMCFSENYLFDEDTVL